MYFKWYSEGKWRPAYRGATLTILLQEGGKEIEILSPKQASIILRAWISTYGSSKEQTRQLHQITVSWANKVISGHIKKQDAWYYFQSTVKTSLKFPLIATYVNDKQYHNIESPALFSGLQASGLPSNMQRSVVAGPLASLGLNNSKIYRTQGLKDIMALMNFGETDSITGKQLRASLESTILEVGFSGPIFTNNYTSLSKYITNTFISNT